MEKLIGIKGAIKVLHDKEGHHYSPKVNPQWHRGRNGLGDNGWGQEAQWRGQQWKLGLFLLLPRQEQRVPPRLVPCHLSSAATGTGWHKYHHKSPCAFTDRGKPGVAVCFYGSPLIDYILEHISNLHIRLPPAHYYGNTLWIRDIGHHWLFLLSAASQRSAPASDCSSASQWSSSPSASPPPPRGLGSLSFLSHC